MDAAEEVGGGLVVAGSDAPELLEFGEEIFNQGAQFIEFFIVIPLFNTVGFGRDDDFDVCLLEKIKNAFFRIERFVRQKRFDFLKNAGQENIRSFEIVRLTGRQMKTRGIAQSVATRMDFCRQSAF